MASSGIVENIILTKIIFTTDGTNGCVKGDTWCKGGLGTPWCGTILIRVVSVMQGVWLLPPYVAEEGMGQVWLAAENMLLEMEGKGVKQDLIPDVGKWNSPMFLLWDGSLTLMYR